MGTESKGIEKITDRIIAEARAEYDAAVKTAEQEAASVLAAAKIQAEQLLEDAEKNGEQEKEKLIRYRKSTADIDAAKTVLAKKQEILSACFQKAEDAIIGMKEEAYIELLVSLGTAVDMYGGKLLFNAEEKARVGQRVCDGLNAAIAALRREKYGDELQYTERFTLEEGVGTMKGGYIVSYRSTFADCTIESLVREYRMELAGEAAKLLFAEGRNG